MYTKFTEILDAVFTCKNLEKMPTVQACTHASAHARTHPHTHAYTYRESWALRKVCTGKATILV